MQPSPTGLAKSLSPLLILKALALPPRLTVTVSPIMDRVGLVKMSKSPSLGTSFDQTSLPVLRSTTRSWVQEVFSPSPSRYMTTVLPSAVACGATEQICAGKGSVHFSLPSVTA